MKSKLNTKNQIDPTFIDKLVENYNSPEDVFGKDGIFTKYIKLS